MKIVERARMKKLYSNNMKRDTSSIRDRKNLLTEITKA
jgi:hypothetical protein